MTRIKRKSRRLPVMSRRTALLVIGVGAGAFLIGFGLTALSFLRSGGPVDVVTVPDVREMRTDEAGRTLEDYDLTLVVGDSLPNPSMAPGAILAQTPLPGQEVSRGTEVRVILSTGQRRPQVPNVDAMPLAMATRALQAAGFEVLVQEVPGEGDPGRVLATNPPSGTPVPLPATITLRVGAAAPPVEMPNLVGMLETNARALVEGLGLNVTEVQYEGSRFGEPGAVVGQDPAPGDSIEAGSPVRLRVTGPPPAPPSATPGVSPDPEAPPAPGAAGPEGGAELPAAPTPGDDAEASPEASPAAEPLAQPEAENAPPAPGREER